MFAYIESIISSSGKNTIIKEKSVFSDYVRKNKFVVSKLGIKQIGVP